MIDEAPQDTRGTFASFGLHPRKNEAKSKEAGRPIYDDVEYIQILLAGDKGSVIHRPATHQDKLNYSREYAAFKAGEDQEAASGTPLKDLPGITRGLVEEARYFKVFTVEHLAEMPEANVQNLGMGWSALRQRARDYIAAAAGLAPLEKLRGENAELRGQMEALKKQMSELIEVQKEHGKAKAAKP